MAKRWCLAVCEDFYELVSRHTPGHTTLNQLRIMTVIIAGDLGGTPLGTTGISQRTGIPASTVSRVCADVIGNGWARECPHPSDRRRTVYRSTAEAITALEGFANECLEIKTRHETRTGETRC